MRRLAWGSRVARFRGSLASGLTQLSGFVLAVLLLGIVSLVAIPAMVATGGVVAWGAIALGQAIGLVGAIFVGYGWNRSGPALVARASASMRRREYIDAVRVKVALLAPTAVGSALLASALAPEAGQYAAVGAVVATLNGLTAIWYFAGLAQSYGYLFFEAIPRALGTLLGVALMRSGHSVYIGLACMGAGLLAGFIAVSIWVYRTTARQGAKPLPARTLLELLVVQRDGVVATTLAAAYIAVPLAIVSVVAPASQPAFALADKMFRQFLVAIRPVVSVIQGWVPRAPVGRFRLERARNAIAAACVLATVLGGGIVIFGGKLLHWLGDGQIATSRTTIVLVAVVLALSTLDAVLGNAVLSALDQLNLAVWATCVGAVVGLPLVALGAIQFGVYGALGGLTIGLIVRIAIELVGIHSTRGVFSMRL